MLYRIRLIHLDQSALCQRIKDAIAAELKTLAVDPGTLELCEGLPDPPVEEALEVAVCLGSARAQADFGLAENLENFLQSGVPVVPLIPKGHEFSEVVPPVLSKINAIDLNRESEVFAALLLLRLVGLTEEQRRVFISYRRTDALLLAEQLWEELGKRGFDVFLDRFTIEPAVDFQARLTMQLADKAFVLFLESPEALTSPWVSHEINFARQNRLGLLALSWPGLADDAKLPDLYPDYRYELNAPSMLPVSYADPVSGKKKEYKVLEDKFCKDLVAVVEANHARAMYRRRRELIGSVEQELRRCNLGFQALTRWSLRVDLQGGNSAVITVVPRPPDVLDVYDLDLLRKSSKGYLVHSLAKGPVRRDELLAWATRDGSISRWPESDLVEMVESL